MLTSITKENKPDSRYHIIYEMFFFSGHALHAHTHTNIHTHTDITCTYTGIERQRETTLAIETDRTPGELEWIR